MISALNPEDEEGRDGLDIEGFSDVWLFLGLYLNSQGYMTWRYSQVHE